MGGIAIYLAFLVTVGGLPVPGGPSPALHTLLLAGALIVIAGVIDDIWYLGIRPRFGVQIAIALLVIHFGDALIANLGAFIGAEPVTMGILAVPFSVFALVGAINAINMSDGIDGLAGSVCAISLFLSAIVAISGERAGDAMALLALVGGILGFLVFNLRYYPLRRAKVFLGDSGSTFLGLAVGYFLIVLTQGENRLIAPVTALWILGVPLLDTAACMIVRIRRGDSPFQPDRGHLHYLLIDNGLTSSRALLVIAVFHTMLGVAGLVGHYREAPENVMCLLFVALFLLYLAGTAKYRNPLNG
ncbi:MAG: UDP-GlcNAc:undecaprenyl-phosphate GlcNAc-1-phosphate transferase [Candidatus Kentron sp. G]|nr:MAG: UDP-GlcNAc:undecaprenyl-phosphate GlcNAc-1-phosphate transferase [Candidatus Kentron sp. G]VFN01349.1 MAG: UDP-GlcNAc:undecaprenyl-phosphate GlcNAc-1-phosphate transferase [Candidatus Kentron sp. G]VFN07173.1 MAG: UDP-GlcNAc:undecaprenyl-phosphate GlcNAc-1-phosphate transferase [Candidatus Kentron sp. G]